MLFAFLVLPHGSYFCPVRNQLVEVGNGQSRRCLLFLLACRFSNRPADTPGHDMGLAAGRTPPIEAGCFFQPGCFTLAAARRKEARRTSLNQPLLYHFLTCSRKFSLKRKSSKGLSRHKPAKPLRTLPIYSTIP